MRWLSSRSNPPSANPDSQPVRQQLASLRPSERDSRDMARNHHFSHCSEHRFRRIAVSWRSLVECHRRSLVRLELNDQDKKEPANPPSLQPYRLNKLLFEEVEDDAQEED